MWVRQVRRLTCDLRINGNIFKIEYESITVSSFLLKNIVKIGGMSIADYTFAEVTEVSVQELRKFQTAGVQHQCMSLPRQWYSVSREFNASDARDKATIEGMSSIIFPAIAR